MRAHLWVIVGLCLFVGGCGSDLKVTKYDPNEPVTGYPYRLKFTQYDIDLKWQIVACTQKNGSKAQFKFKISANPKVKTSLDPDHVYVVDPLPMQGWFQTSEFKMEWYDDRSVKSVNASVDDQTSTAIVNTLTGISKIATLGLGTGIHAAIPTVFSRESLLDESIFSTTSSDNSNTCDKINENLDKIKGETRKVEEKKSTVEKDTTAVKKLTIEASAPDASKTTKGNLAKAESKLITSLAELEDQTKLLNEVIDGISDSKTVTWPVRSSQFASNQVVGSPAGNNTTTPDEAINPSAKKLEEWGVGDTDATKLKIYFCLYPVLTDGKSRCIAPEQVANDALYPQSPPATIKGLPYREPRQMRLEVCSNGPCFNREPDKIDNLVTVAEGPVLQGGSMFYLPFRPQTFASVNSSAGFAQTGEIMTAGSNQLRGAGTGAAEAFKGSAEQVTAIAEANRGAKTKALQAQAAELKAQKELNDAFESLKPSADKQTLEAYQADAALAKAELEKIQAYAALEAARKQIGD